MRALVGLSLLKGLTCEMCENDMCQNWVSYVCHKSAYQKHMDPRKERLSGISSQEFKNINGLITSHNNPSDMEGRDLTQAFPEGVYFSPPIA